MREFGTHRYDQGTTFRKDKTRDTDASNVGEKDYWRARPSRAEGLEQTKDMIAQALGEGRAERKAMERRVEEEAQRLRLGDYDDGEEEWYMSSATTNCNLGQKTAHDLDEENGAERGL